MLARPIAILTLKADPDRDNVLSLAAHRLSERGAPTVEDLYGLARNGGFRVRFDQVAAGQDGIEAALVAYADRLESPAVLVDLATGALYLARPAADGSATLTRAGNLIEAFGTAPTKAAGLQIVRFSRSRVAAQVEAIRAGLTNLSLADVTHRVARDGIFAMTIPELVRALLAAIQKADRSITARAIVPGLAFL